ncbi:unnamed protein product [Arabis nemorensis]|uniref:Uncharacterized protein n=1 Tax=Arabis nemorensis TaxID=586526 RepID=A0A565C4U3_9BRAS|nr:unnamed protein product [Arabis nemorensis]
METTTRMGILKSPLLVAHKRTCLDLRGLIGDTLPPIQDPIRQLIEEFPLAITIWENLQPPLLTQEKYGLNELPMARRKKTFNRERIRKGRIRLSAPALLHQGPRGSHTIPQVGEIRLDTLTHLGLAGQS